MAQAFVALSAWQVILAGLLFFGGIYLVFGAATWLLTQHILPALGIGRPLDPRPPVSYTHLTLPTIYSV